LARDRPLLAVGVSEAEWQLPRRGGMTGMIGLMLGTIARTSGVPCRAHLTLYERPSSVSFEGVDSQQSHFIDVESSLHPTQHDVVDALLVAQF
jgi:hypothetical protein